MITTIVVVVVVITNITEAALMTIPKYIYFDTMRAENHKIIIIIKCYC